MYPRMMPLEMTKQTLELRDLVESGVNIWDFEYPSYYKDAAKAEFEKKVIEHFYFRQIGAETVGRFLHYFRRTVREIMPLYIQRYESVDLMKDPEIRPLDNYNMIEELTRSTTEEGSENTTGNSTGSGTTTGSSTGSGSKNSLESTSGVEAFSETPEGQLPFNVVTNTGGQTVTLGHASTVTQRTGQNALTDSSTASEESSTTSETSGTSENSSETSRTGSETHKLTRRGNIGVTTYAQLLEGYRQTFLNIDMEIIKELESCFLGVY